MQAHLTGPWRQPRNTAADQKGGIHDDATASELGFRGGTVAGSIHLEQFPPLLVETFGQAWWQHGSLSMYFRSATIDREPVRCLVGAPEPTDAGQRARVWMEKEDGTLIMEGSAAIGADPASELNRRLQQVRPAGELRVFADMRAGTRTGPQPTRIDGAEVDRQLAVITEPLAGYQADASGGRLLPATAVVHAVLPAEHKLTEPAHKPFVGLYGAIEISFLDGPLLADTDYTVDGEILALSDSPQTEMVWWGFDISEGDRPVARVVRLDRIMKGSSPLWDAA